MDKRKIKLDHLLWGGDSGQPAAIWSHETQNYLRSSTLLKDTPHVKLLQQYQELGEEIFFSGRYENTRYYQNALLCQILTGHYFNCTTPDEIVQQMRRFVEHFKGIEREPIQHQSESDIPHVIKNELSSYYEILDGHHKLAIAYVNGEIEVECEIAEGTSLTAIQHLVLSNKWTEGELLLYQPLPYPELENFITVRHCKDRWEMMYRFMSQFDREEFSNYLDLGCSYGYFLHQMEYFGFEVLGVDNCESSLKIAEVCYQVARENLYCLEFEDFFEHNHEEFDVVACLSVIHHYALGRGKLTAVEFIKKLDEVTGKILFFDMGQSHEQWFAEELSEWDTPYIIQWIKDHTSFTEVIPLGKDQDNIGIYKQNYHRTLFACTRE